MATIMLLGPLDSESPSSSLVSNCVPIHSSRQPPTICSHGICSSLAARKVSTMRSTTAAPEPNWMALRCCSGGSDRAASAMTTALSPESTMLMPMTSSKPIQNAELDSNSMSYLPMTIEGIIL